MSFMGNYQTPSGQVIPSLQPTNQPSQPQLMGMFWAQGLDGARNYRINSANSEVFLRDVTNPNVLYLKSTDQFGNEKSFLRYTLPEPEPVNNSCILDTSDFVTKQELTDTLESMFKKYMSPNKQRNRNNKGGDNHASQES